MLVEFQESDWEAFCQGLEAEAVADAQESELVEVAHHLVLESVAVSEDQSSEETEEDLCGDQRPSPMLLLVAVDVSAESVSEAERVAEAVALMDS